MNSFHEHMLLLLIVATRGASTTVRVELTLAGTMSVGCRLRVTYCLDLLLSTVAEPGNTWNRREHTRKFGGKITYGSVDHIPRCALSEIVHYCSIAMLR